MRSFVPTLTLSLCKHVWGVVCQWLVSWAWINYYTLQYHGGYNYIYMHLSPKSSYISLVPVCGNLPCLHYLRDDSRLVPSQWEMSLQSNAVSHRLGANLESSLLRLVPNQWETSLQSNAVSHWLGANLESSLLSCVPLIHESLAK